MSFNVIIETPRLLLREVAPEDAEGFFAMDSDPAVMRYLGGKTVESIQQSREIIALIQEQYTRLGIGRWAVLEKTTGQFLGWCGLKRMAGLMVNDRTDFIDIGYRLQQQHWGKGYATEAALACLNWGFEHLDTPEICAFAEEGNTASRHVLLKIGLQEGNVFEFEELRCIWFSLRRENRQMPPH